MSSIEPQSPTYYINAIEKLFLIVNKQAATVQFKVNEPQTKVLMALKNWDIILKARQEGISSLILALFAIDFLTIENCRCVVIAHEAGATQKLLDKVKFYLESLKTTFPGELPYKLKYNSKTELVNTEKNSIFYVGTAGSRTFGRGDTIHNCLASEFAFWPNQEKMFTGLIQAIPREGRFIIESTANGVGNFHHSLWKKSQGNDSSFKTHFLPWFLLSEYSIPITGTFVPTEEEKLIQAAYSLTNEQLNWRRWKISQMNGNLDTFNQEYPATADDAFIVSGNPIWSPTMLKKYLLRCQKPLAQGDLIGAYDPFFEPNEKGMLKIWKQPVKGHDYVIGSDVAEGLEVSTEGEKDQRTDYSCAYVMDKHTAEMVACLHGRIEADLWGRKLELLGRYYNSAFIGVERNHQGLAPLMVLRDLNYPKLYYREKIGLDADKVTPQLGWWTDRFTRPLMVDEGGKWLREERTKIYDESLLGEMLSFVRYPDGQGRAAQGAFDDRVMAFLLTIQMYLRSPFSANMNPIESVLPQGVGDVNDFNFDNNSEGGSLLGGEVDFVI